MYKSTHLRMQWAPCRRAKKWIFSLKCTWLHVRTFIFIIAEIEYAIAIEVYISKDPSSISINLIIISRVHVETGWNFSPFFVRIIIYKRFYSIVLGPICDLDCQTIQYIIFSFITVARRHSVSLYHIELPYVCGDILKKKITMKIYR